MKIKSKLLLLMSAFLIINLIASMGLRMIEKSSIEATAEQTIEKLNSISSENVYGRLGRLATNASDYIYLYDKGIEEENEPYKDSLKRFLDNNSEINSIYLIDNQEIVLTEILRGEGTPNLEIGKKSSDEFVSLVLSQQSTYIQFHDTTADVYYPVVANGRIQYVLYISIATASYYESAKIAETALANILLQNQNNTITMNITTITLTLILLLGVFLVIHLSFNVIKRLVDNFNKIAEGDLTVRKINIKRKDEIGLLANSYNKMVESMQNLISNINDSAIDVDNSSKHLELIIQQTIESTELISKSMEEIASGSSIQRDSILKGNEAINTINDNVKSILTYITTSENNAISASQKSQEGNEIIQSSINQMNTLEKKVQALEVSISQLSNRSMDIKNITGVISSITEQTNLLALNASIEAARAGAHGKGFAVVANEVRKLAENSGTATNQIKDIIVGIEKDLDDVITEMELVRKEVASSKESNENAGKLFYLIQQSINNLACRLSDIVKEVDTMSNNTNEVVLVVNQISDISNSNSIETETVSAATQQQLSSMETVNHSAKNLNLMAEKLRELMKKFCI